MDEYFDVVDENDEVIGIDTRSEVHRNGLRHRAIHLFIFNEDGLLFLQKRSLHKDLNPGTWDSSVSGHVDAGENYDEAAAREIIEEISPPHKVELKRVAYIECCPETGNEFVWVYRGISNGPFTLHPQEIETGRWIHPRVVMKSIDQNPPLYSPCFSYIWRRVEPLLDIPQNKVNPD